eukprot:CAMPEP_0202902264 /NCGR_PEP_ID=MMETSP1392-20130828/16755_1 /ASSEMBLY_ACC=CAM_ASM_000868 /TAXON_ID=225041 /ORGANISM="Chlamydomonas chlamydogama, Strain SAG 11-48b" /LENGTH=283 /DNA_ID=CAMNT_0049589005 /DNA_START=115 /DNA_END=966 /DNA_ORIENTATION=-
MTTICKGVAGVSPAKHAALRSYGPAPFRPISVATRSFNRQRLVPRASADPQTQPKPAVSPSAPVEYIEDTEFNISKVSFGSILTPAGSFLLVYGFGAYFALLPGGDVSSIMLVYGFPMAVLGFALSYAQLKPVPCRTTKAAFEQRAAQCTDIQKQIREDVTRFRYGDEQHLEEALDKIFKFNKAGGIARRVAPVLTGIREELVEGAYSLVLEFESSLEMSKWEERQPKFQSFFGPGIIARLDKTDKGMDVALICDGSGAGRTGKEKKDVLPPLLPGLKARQQD